VKSWLKLLSPFIPHICEELWSKLGEGFASSQRWPEVREELINPELETLEEYLDSVLEDIGEIRRVLKKKPALICLYVAAKWKLEVFRVASRNPDFKHLLEFASERGVPQKTAAEFVKGLLNLIKLTDPEKLRRLASVQTSELEYLKRNLIYLERKTGATVRIFQEDDAERYDPAGRASKAMPFKPAIHLE